MSGMCAVLLVECSRTWKWTMYIICITATQEFVYEIILQEALRKTSVTPLPGMSLGKKKISDTFFRSTIFPS